MRRLDSAPGVPFLPPSTNEQYRGAIGAARFLTLLALLTIVPGCIHTFLPDGGAGVIAGIDLTQCGPVIVALFAWAGATQIVFGIVMLLASVRYRNFVPLTLGLVLIERTLHALNAWVLKPGAGHHSPEHYAVIVGLPFILLALAYSLRARPQQGLLRLPS
jgi:hypothetical protein